MSQPVMLLECLDWLASAIEGSDLTWLPQMETDVTLRSAERTIIIECKYTESLFQNRFFSQRFRSAHLYQLCAYLRNLEGGAEPDRQADGILLYPTTGVELDQSYQLHGHRVRVKTVDLNQSWTSIEKALLSILQPIPAG
jgi:5-methylcytosine-specific restriction enzyme subunit McrC